MKFSELFYKNLDFLQSDKKFIIHQGGTSSTKTISNLQAILMLAEKKKETGCLISVVSESYPHLKRGAIRDFKSNLVAGEAFKPSNYNKTDQIYTIGKSTIEFFSADQSDRVRGPRRDFLFINEANNIPYETFTQLEIRTREKIIIDYNPTAEFWVHSKLMPRKEHIYVQSTYKDNPFLEESIIKSIESRKHTDPNWWKVYGEGETGTLEGVIFKNWDVVSSILPNARHIGYGQDFGYSCFIGKTKIKCEREYKKISKIKKGDKVLTRLGYQKVKNRFNNGLKRIIKRKIILSDNSEIEICGTHNHHFNVNNKWKKLSQIKKGDKLYISKERNIIDTKKENIAATFFQKVVNLDCIEKYTKNIKEKFKKGISYITLMAMRLIIVPQIWLLSALVNIVKYMEHLVILIKQRKLKRLEKRMDLIDQTGNLEGKKLIKAYNKKGELANTVIKNMYQQTHISCFVHQVVIKIVNILERKMKYNSYAKTAIKGLWQTNIVNQNLAQKNVQVCSLSVKEIRTTDTWQENVYNLEIENINEYFANDILVYNCDPASLVDVYMMDNELYVQEKIYQTGLTNQDLLKEYRDLGIKTNIEIYGDSAEPKSIEEIRRAGYMCLPVEKGADSINFGIGVLNQYKMHITADSVNLIKELRNYQWATDRMGNQLAKPIDNWNHAIDATRYLAMMKLARKVKTNYKHSESAQNPTSNLRDTRF